METGQINSLLSDHSKKTEFSELTSHLLCISISNTEMQVGIFDVEKSYALRLENYSLLDHKLHSILEDDVFQEEFSDVRLAVKTQKVVLIPREMNSTDLKESLNSKFDLNPSALRKDTIPVLDAELFYESNAFADEVVRKFPKTKFTHSAVDLISQGMSRNRFSNGVRVYANLDSRLLEILVIADNKMVAFSCEEINSYEDAIYFISAHLKNVSFNQLEDKLHLSGAVTEASEVFLHFKARVKQTLLNSGFSYLRTHKDLMEKQKQNYFSVINAFQCV